MPQKIAAYHLAKSRNFPSCQLSCEELFVLASLNHSLAFLNVGEFCWGFLNNGVKSLDFAVATFCSLGTGSGITFSGANEFSSASNSAFHVSQRLYPLTSNQFQVSTIVTTGAITQRQIRIWMRAENNHF